MYQKISQQTNKLGSFERSTLGGSGLGQADFSSIINSVGQTVNNIVGTIVGGQVRRSEISATKAISITSQIEGTKRLGITTTGATQQAAIEAQRLDIQLSNVSKLILTAGVTVVLLIISGGWTYKYVGK